MDLTRLVDPGHAVVGRLLAGLRAEGVEPGDFQALLDKLRKELSVWRVVARHGPGSYEQAEETRSGNCVDLATLFCAVMRRAGHLTCHVVLGSWRGVFPAVVHMWALVKPPDGGDFLLIDPIGMTVSRCGPAALEQALTITAVFDDTVVVVGRDQRMVFWQRLLIGESEDPHVEHV